MPNWFGSKVDWRLPKRLGTLILDIDAQRGTYQDRLGASAVTVASADGDAVGTVQDQSGQGNHFIAASDDSRPTLKVDRVNGRRTILFNGVDQYLQQSSSPICNGRTALTFAAVVRHTSLDNQQGLFSGATADGSSLRFGLWKRTSSSGNYHKAQVQRGTSLGEDNDPPAPVYPGRSLSVPSRTVATTDWYYRTLKVAYTGENNGVIADYVDGLLVGWHDFLFLNESNQNPMASGNTLATIGCLANVAANSFLNGEIARLLVWSTFLSEAETDSLHNYLKSYTSVSFAADTPVTLNVSDQASITAKRNAIIAEIWSGNGYPSSTISSWTEGVADPIQGITQSTNLLQVDSHELQMSDNDADPSFKSVTCHLWRPVAAADAGRLVLLALDHGNDWDSTTARYRDLIVELLNAGFTVAGFAMPDDGSVATHNTYPNPTATLNYLKFFIEPGVVLLNTLASSYDEVYMAGLSGGGWATTLLSAIDTRIQKSYEVAGSLSLLQWEGRDWEQFLPGLADLPLDYPDLHVMATDGGRDKRQTLNFYDSCCFNYTNFVTGPSYLTTVEDGVEALSGSGTWQHNWDASANNHRMTEETRPKMLALFNANTPPASAVLLRSILDGTHVPDTDGLLLDSSGGGNNEQAVQSSCSVMTGSQAFSTNNGPDLSGDHSVSLWIKWTDTALATVFQNRRGGLSADSQSGITVNQDATGATVAGAVNFRIRSTNCAWSGSLNDGQWHHVVGTKSGTDMELWVDGVSRATATAGAVNSGDCRLVIGANHTGVSSSLLQYYTGSVMAVGIASSVLTPANIADLYARKGAVLSVFDRFYPIAEAKAQGAAYDVIRGTDHPLPIGIHQIGTQDLFHYNLAKGFTLDDGFRVPALLSGATDAKGSAISNPSGSWHNAAETKLDLSTSGGVTDWAFGDQAVAPEYYTQDSSVKSSNFKRYTF